MGRERSVGRERSEGGRGVRGGEERSEGWGGRGEKEHKTITACAAKNGMQYIIMQVFFKI